MWACSRVPCLCIPGSQSEAAGTCCWNLVSPAAKKRREHETWETKRMKILAADWDKAPQLERMRCVYTEKTKGWLLTRRTDVLENTLMWETRCALSYWRHACVRAKTNNSTWRRRPARRTSTCQVLLDVRKKTSYTCFGSLASADGRWCRMTECRSF